MNKIWRIAIVAVAVLAMAGAAVGFVTAQSDGDVPGKERLSNFIGRLAENLGISQEELEGAIDQTQLELVDDAVASGDLTQEQAASLRERIESGEGGPFPGALRHGFKKGFGFGYRHGFGDGFSKARLGGASNALLDFLGITADELRAARAEEQSLAQIAEANGVSRDALIAFLVEQTKDQLAAKVEEGKLDQARADRLLERFQGQVDNLVDNLVGSIGHRFGGPWGPFHQKDAEPETTGDTI